jgi:D-glycero-D-manno-heptose 1,7-bisphosphate phosphatase
MPGCLGGAFGVPEPAAGVVIVNRSTNIKHPRDIEMLPRAAEAIARLNGAGFEVAICTNQPEVSRGAMTEAQLDAVHEALRARLGHEGAVVGPILCCTGTCKSPRRKPGADMLREALQRYDVTASETPFVGDQADDLKAAFHAGCPRLLVRTGLGRKTLERGVPSYVEPRPSRGRRVARGEPDPGKTASSRAARSGRNRRNEGGTAASKIAMICCNSIYRFDVAGSSVVEDVVDRRRNRHTPAPIKQYCNRRSERQTFGRPH